MSTPITPTTVAKLGPGTLTIGSVGAEVDISCLLNGGRVTSSKDQADSTTKLCGSKRTGAISYAFELSGNTDTDPGDPDGILSLSHSAKGTEQPFTFTPNTDAGLTVTGTIVLDPLDIGADAYGDDLTSDFAFAIVGDPILTFTPPAGGATTASAVLAGARS